jgi:hypothetical protein
MSVLGDLADERLSIALGHPVGRLDLVLGGHYGGEPLRGSHETSLNKRTFVWQWNADMD